MSEAAASGRPALGAALIPRRVSPRSALVALGRLRRRAPAALERDEAIRRAANEGAAIRRRVEAMTRALEMRPQL